MNQFDFPQYRKTLNNKNFYCIYNDKKVEEIQIIGSVFTTHVILAKILPEFNHINDLLENTHQNLEQISEKDYEEIKIWCSSNLKKLH